MYTRRLRTVSKKMKGEIKWREAKGGDRQALALLHSMHFMS